MNDKMNKSKKAQLNQVFTIIATLLIAGVIILVGAKAIGGTMKSKCTTDLVTFQNDISQAIKDNNHYGSVTGEKFRAPCKYTTLCLVNTEAIREKTSLNSFPDELSSEAKFLIKNSVESGTEQNIFLISSDETKPAGFASELMVEGGDVLCIPSKAGDFSMTMYGQGRTTKIKSKNSLDNN